MAFNRFGLGARPDDVIPASPVAWLTNQLVGPDPYNASGLPSTADGLALLVACRLANQTGPTTNLQIQTRMFGEANTLLQNALTTPVPFRERLVWFWANHFTVQAQNLEVACVVGSYIREAIRPHVTGTFQDMLLAVMQHPAMICTLNNDVSVGPDSVNGLRCQAAGCNTLGINENLARECLELHTVGLAAGYTQADVDALAMLLTGWGVNLRTAPYGFAFTANSHEPVPQTLMGHSYAGTQAGGLAALSWLATQPSTYTHLATKLVTHFVSDTPSQNDIEVVASALSATGGNLAAAATAVVSLPSAWQPYNKLRTPVEFAIAAMRAAGLNAATTGNAGNPRVVAAALGQTIFQPPFPNGYSDLAADWLGPAQMLLRADYINSFAAQVKTTLDPMGVAASSIGPLLRPSTVNVMNAVSSPHDKLSLLLMSPEFQRR